MENPFPYGIIKMEKMETKNNEPKRLYRSNNRMLAGVCAGIAEYFDVDPTLVRVGYVAVSILCAGFPGLLLYLIMMIIMPQRTGEV